MLRDNAASTACSGFSAAVFFTGLLTVVASFSASAQSLLIEFDDSGDYVFTHDERATITRIANEVVTEVRVILPRLPTSINLWVNSNTFVIEETGEMGMAPEPARINWTVDASRSEGVETIANKRLRPTLFHELHHLSRGYVVRGGAPRTSFMDVVVSEGMATAFERDFAGAKPPWGEYPEEISTWVDELIALPMSAFGSYTEWMIEHPDGRRWIGYKAGTFIVDQAMAASGLTSAELVLIDTQKVLELAGVVTK